MKIIVTNPPWPGEGYGTRSNIRWPHRRGDKVLTFPIYLAYAVAVLKEAGFDAKGIDAVDREWGIPKFVEELKKLKPDVILMEVSTPSIMHDLESAQTLKKETGCMIVFCGPHATYFHKEIIDNYSFVDVCIRKEFEYTIRDICKAVDKKKPLSKVPGITFRGKDNKAIVNPDRPFIANLDELPMPDRNDFKIENYQQAFFNGKKTALIITSRGCPYNCTFCLWPNSLLGHQFRSRSPKNVVDEIELLIKTENIDGVYFDDDTFLVDKVRAKEICEEIVKRRLKISWRCMARVNNIDYETLQAMKKAGCTDVFYGFESGSERILKDVNKGITKEQIREAVKLTKKAGLVASGSFIIGLPEESKETIEETVKFAISLKADYVQFAIAAPFPGTALYEQVKREGLLCVNSWSDFDGCHGPAIRTRYLSKRELSGVLRKIYLKYYTSPAIIWQNLSMCRSTEDIARIFKGAKSVLARIIYFKS